MLLGHIQQRAREGLNIQGTLKKAQTIQPTTSTKTSHLEGFCGWYFLI